MQVETVPKVITKELEKPVETPDYQRELLVMKIADFLCDDNAEVRSLLKGRFKDMTTEDLKAFAEQNNVLLI